jgi:uncharacterized membrane protein
MAEPHLKRGRLEAFSDGVIAIIVTIMVLELKIPETALDGDLWTHLVQPLAPKLGSYAMSFLVVAIMWVNHHALVDALRVVDRTVLWWNNLMLFSMSLIPLVTGFWGEHPLAPIAVAAYGAVLAFSATVFTLLRGYLMQRETQNASLLALHRRVFTKSVLGATLYASSAPLAFLSPWISIAIFIAIPAAFFLPDFGGDAGD